MKTTGNKKTWFDAVGYSWDANYRISQNERAFHGSVSNFELLDLDADQDSIPFVSNYNIAASGYVKIDEEFGIHKKILHFYENDLSGATWVENDFSAAQSEGTIEFWYKIKYNQQPTYITLYDSSSTRAVHLKTGSTTGWYYYYSAAWNGISALGSLSSETWYHVKIVFDCGSDTFHLWVNNVDSGELNFENAVSDIATIRFSTDTSNVQEHVYVDAVGYSWESYYDVADDRLLDYNVYYNIDDITDDLYYPLKVLKKPYELHPTSGGKYLVGDKAILKTLTSFSLDNSHVIRLYDTIDKLVFEGNLVQKEEVQGQYVLWKCKSLNRFELADRVTHDWTSDASTVLEMLIDSVSNAGQSDGRLILDTSGDDPTGDFTFAVEELPLVELLKQLADLKSRVIVITPEGKLKLTTGKDLGIIITKDTGHVASKPITEEVVEEINWVKVYGGWDPANGRPFYGIDQDADAVEANGKIAYWDVYDNILSDSECATKAAAIRTNLNANLRWVKVKLKGLPFVSIYSELDFSFTTYSLLASVDSYYVLECELELFSEIGKYKLCTGIISKERYGKSPYDSHEQGVNDVRKRIPESDNVEIDLTLIPGPNTELTIWGVKMDAIDEYFAVQFYVPSNIDVSKDLTVTFIFKSNESSAVTAQGELDVARYLVDGSQSPTSIETNLNFDVAFTAAGGVKKETYTLSSSDLLEDKLYNIVWTLKSAYTIYAVSVQVKYFIKRTI